MDDVRGTADPATLESFGQGFDLVTSNHLFLLEILFCDRHVGRVHL